jgi:serine/threonine-protein kinase
MPSRTSAAPPVRLRDPVPPDRDGFSRSPGAVPGRVGPIVGGVVVLVVVLVVVVLLVLLLT